MKKIGIGTWKNLEVFKTCFLLDTVTTYVFLSTDETPQLTLPTIPPPTASTELPQGKDQTLSALDG